MSLRTVVETAIHFESFRNVDLFHQGLYHLKTRLYREDGCQRILATPHSHFACPTQVEATQRAKSTRTDHHHLIPAHVVEDQCTFSTRSFLIRYCEEEVELDDVGQFRIDCAVEEAENMQPLILEVDLMFADLTQHGGADRFGEQPDVDSTEFKSVSTQLLRLHEVQKGLHEFCPVVFDEFHFCLANIIVHTVVVDFRFRIRPLAAPFPQTKPTLVQRSKGAPDGTVGAADSRAAGTVGIDGGASQAALSLAERLFAGSSGNAELLAVAEGLYQKHIGTLAASYSGQAQWFNLVCERCLTEAQRDILGDLVGAPELNLPEGMSSTATSSSAYSGKDKVNGQTSLKVDLATRLGPNVTDRTLAKNFAYDLNRVSCQLLELWHKELNVISYAGREIAAFLRIRWDEQIVEQWSVSLLKETMRGDLAEPEDKRIGDAHDVVAEKLRRTASAKPPENVEDLSLLPAMDQRPVLFEQRYMPKPSAQTHVGYSQLPITLDGRIPSAPKDYRGTHLFVLVHGFQGNSFDMRLMKNNLALLYPDAIFLCSNSNEDNTEGDFSEMGIRLAQEVVNYICDWCPGGALGRLSFIAHSIGGLIVRSALPLLHEYSSKLFTLLTFSTPHVGYFLKNITLFHVGLRVLQSWRQSTCLAQLSMADNPDPKETFLHRLSQTKGFELFQNIVLVSCPSDQYSPFDSARVEIGGMLDKHSHKDVYMDMVRNIWEPVKPERVFRFDVNFYIPDKNLDTFIGRASHIQFLECQPIMKMIIHNYSFLFR